MKFSRNTIFLSGLLFIKMAFVFLLASMPGWFFFPGSTIEHHSALFADLLLLSSGTAGLVLASLGMAALIDKPMKIPVRIFSNSAYSIFIFLSCIEIYLFLTIGHFI